MTLIKNDVIRELTDKETIKIFLEAGWEEVKQETEVKATNKSKTNKKNK